MGSWDGGTRSGKVSGCECEVNQQWLPFIRQLWQAHGEGKVASVSGALEAPARCSEVPDLSPVSHRSGSVQSFASFSL